MTPGAPLFVHHLPLAGLPHITLTLTRQTGRRLGLTAYRNLPWQTFRASTSSNFSRPAIPARPVAGLRNIEHGTKPDTTRPHSVRLTLSTPLHRQRLHFLLRHHHILPPAPSSPAPPATPTARPPFSTDQFASRLLHPIRKDVIRPRFQALGPHLRPPRGPLRVYHLPEGCRGR